MVPEFEAFEDDDDTPNGRYLEVAGFFHTRVSDDVRLVVDQERRTWHFYAANATPPATYCLKFYTSEVRLALLSIMAATVECVVLDRILNSDLARGVSFRVSFREGGVSRRHATCGVIRTHKHKARVRVLH